ncbi:uncharacterized protein LOC122389279 isoform X1 [Amphibalanus amphitrite]|uniref:uncharacterized protein LOC122369145 isoform X1 n=2 Tax=Amphibalanus amphitrite TaxID=1232801 RepID=UPI001C928AD0|nr:uncharacterized protein LOC122369145 isoform X1 [Amphibalanus amphitrite]XP_043231040.1 uncharacterized protein LOC122386175 isoform X1 [Amphibalanus amphitrite]XP_043234443.1 uncharacterized protein LOC122387885 isoform X1 [Amphibalanus amphitrite]XP_043237093.1 uncharacterized protein LOC122389279 isoform X1 [Amphibalanus amphitrite]
MPLHKDEWVRIGAPDAVLDWIMNGVPVPVRDIPEPRVFENPCFNEPEKKFLETELMALEKRGVIAKVADVPHCVSPLKVVPKKNSKYRLICDLRYVNSHCDVPHFSSEGVSVLPEVMRGGELAVTVDLKDGFYHFPVREEFRTYLGFQYGGCWYVWCFLPFGLVASPYYFHKCVRVVIEYMRGTERLSVMAYVDDFLLTSTKNRMASDVKIFLDTLASLGLCVNWEKSCLEPSNVVSYLGFDVHCASEGELPFITVPKCKVSKLKQDIGRMLKRPTVSARLLARIAGRCISMMAAVFPAKLKLRNIYRLLNSRMSWDEAMPWSPEAREDLAWWLTSLDGWNGRLLVPPASCDLQLSTDASETGWGATLSTPVAQTASGFWRPEQLERMFGPHTIDRFASLSTALLPVYNSRFRDPGTAGVDALGQNDWQQHNNFINPPFRLVARVLDAVQAQRAEATLIAPMWPGQPWMERLRRLSVCPPLRLPPVTQACIPLLPHQQIEPHRNRRWTLFAWRISGEPG